MKSIKIIPTLLGCILIFLIGCTKKDPIIPAGWGDLSNVRIAAVFGSTGERFIKTNYENANFRGYDSTIDAIVDLKLGKVDYLITSYVNATNYIKQNPDLIIKPGYVESEGVAIAVRKDDSKLLADLSKLIQKFKEDGTLVDVVKRWVRESNVPYEPKEIPVHEGGKVLRVGISADMEPMIFMAYDKVIGLDAELIERIAYELKMVVEYHNVPFDALIALLDSDLVDVVISNLTSTEERRLLVNFTEDYYSNPLVLMEKK